MGERLHVLIIEDSEDDAVLTVRRLSKAGLGIDYDVVESAAGLSDALASAEWDLIISDYSLPDLNASDALEAVRSVDSEVPFVVVSGTIGEERAADLMRLGATDYVLKDHPRRLVPVVRRAINEAQERALLDGTQQALVVAGQEWHDTFEAIADGVLVLDAAGRVERFNRSAGELLGKQPGEIRGAVALDLLQTACESSVPERSGWLAESSTRFEWGPRQSDGMWFEVASDPVIDSVGDLVGFVVVVSDVTAHKQSEEELTALVDRIERTLRGTVNVAARIVESRDPYTAGHQERVAEFAAGIARRMGLPDAQIEAIRIAGLLHDVGKIGVPAEILVKPGELSDVEWSLMRGHPETGADILADIEFDVPIGEIVRQHHERLDGSGYPHGLVGDEIMLEARILAVADVAEAMLAHRPYRPACGVPETRQVLLEGRGTLFDERAVDAMLALLDAESAVAVPAAADPVAR